MSSFPSGGWTSIVTVLAHQDDAAIDAYMITFRPEDQRLEAMPTTPSTRGRWRPAGGIQPHEIEISPDIVSLLPRSWMC